MRTFYPKREVLITNLIGSVLKSIGMDCEETLREVDKFLKYDFDNIIIILYRGLCGRDIEKENGYLKKHQLKNTYSVYPSDDASSRRMLDNYFDIRKVNSKSDYKIYGIDGNDDVYERIVNISQNPGKKVIYTYCDSFNSSEDISGRIKKLIDCLSNSVVLVSSYCGRDISKSYIKLEDNKMFMDNVRNLKYISKRCVTFDCDDIEEIGDGFNTNHRIFSYEESVDKGVVISGEKYQYMLCCKGDVSFECGNDCLGGGLSEYEMLFPLMVFEKKREDEREIIRRADSEDYDELSKLISEAYLKRWECRKDIFEKVEAMGRSEFSKYCGKCTANGVNVVELDGNIVGYLLWEVKPFSSDSHFNRSNIMIFKDVYVLEEYRRRGMATRMYNEALKYAKKLKMSRVEFRVWEFDDEVLKFINSLQVERLRSCYEIKI